jgi:hypothetical protein
LLHPILVWLPCLPATAPAAPVADIRATVSGPAAIGASIPVNIPVYVPVDVHVAVDVHTSMPPVAMIIPGRAPKRTRGEADAE